jgi:hypothetical protein
MRTGIFGQDRYSYMRPIGPGEKAGILLAVVVVVLLGMILVNGLLLGHQPGNAPNNIVMTGGE